MSSLALMTPPPFLKSGVGEGLTLIRLPSVFGRDLAACGGGGAMSFQSHIHTWRGT